MEVSDPADLRPLIGLSSVHVLNVAHNGMACMGLEFGCVWDEEHGAGVMTHNGGVIATGQPDCSFMEWTRGKVSARRNGRPNPHQALEDRRRPT
jgi:hypothetical protein